MPSYRRRKRLVNPALQLKFILAFLSMAGISVLIQALMLSRTLTHAAASLPNDGVHLLYQLPEMLRTNLLFTFLLLVPLMLSVGVLVTFRVTGPLKRFEIYLTQLAAGERPGPCRLREYDELKDLCELLNEATVSLQAPPSAAAESSESSPSKAA